MSGPLDDEDLPFDLPEDDGPPTWMSEAPPTAPQAPQRAPLYWHGKATTPDTPWLVKRLLPEVGTVLLSGQWGMLKTFTLLDLAASLITGNPFAGYRVVRKGGVLVFAAEGAYELPKRLKGLQSCGKLPDEPQPIAWQDTCPPLLSRGAVDDLVRVAVEVQQHMQKEFGVPLALIAVDTVASAANFKDENSSAEGQAMMNVLAELAKRMKCCVIGVDHFGKMIETGTRGASSKEAAADAVLALIGDRALIGRVSNCRMAVRKLRGGPTGAEIAYTAREIDLGTDRDGDPVTTLTIEWQTEEAVAPKVVETKAVETKVVRTFRDAFVEALDNHGETIRVHGDGPEVKAVDVQKVREEFGRRHATGEADAKKRTATANKAFRRTLNDLPSGFATEARDDREWIWRV